MGAIALGISNCFVKVQHSARLAGPEDLSVSQVQRSVIGGGGRGGSLEVGMPVDQEMLTRFTGLLVYFLSIVGSQTRRV